MVRLCKIKMGTYLLKFQLILPNINKPRYFYLSRKKSIYYAIYKSCLVGKDIYHIIIPTFTRNDAKVSFQVVQNRYQIAMFIIALFLYWLTNSKWWS